MPLNTKVMMSQTGTRKLAIRFVWIIFLVFFAAICVNAKSIFSVTKFFFLMKSVQLPNGIPSSTSITKVSFSEQSAQIYLKELELIARYFTKQSEENQRLMIKMYTEYINFRVTDRYYERVVNLYVFQRLVFDVPSEYPLDDAQEFVVWIFKPEHGEDTVNLMWPLEIVDDQVIIKDKPGRIVSHYQAFEEYEYFRSRFPLRLPDNSE